MKIVFVDGTPCIKKESDIEPLKRLGEVVIYNNIPSTEEELIERIKDANVVYTDLTRITPTALKNHPK